MSDGRDSRDKRGNDMPWRIQVRLDCLDLARESAIRRGITDIAEEAERMERWVLRAVPPLVAYNELQEGKEAEGPAA